MSTDPDQGCLLRATSRQEAEHPEFNDVLVVPLRHVLAVADPRVGDPWDIGEFTDDDVRQEMATPSSCTCQDHRGYGCRACNLARVAWFVREGLNPNDFQPISLDVGVGRYVPSWPLEDGNHRVAAAAVRGEDLVVVEVAGDWDRALALLIDGVSWSDVLDGE